MIDVIGYSLGSEPPLPLGRGIHEQDWALVAVGKFCLYQNRYLFDLSIYRPSGGHSAFPIGLYNAHNILTKPKRLKRERC
jgi:hypothetical protein